MVTVGLVVVAMVGGLVVFVAGVLAQRQPPYPM
jgi:hypothetical protein